MDAWLTVLYYAGAPMFVLVAAFAAFWVLFGIVAQVRKMLGAKRTPRS